MDKTFGRGRKAPSALGCNLVAHSASMHRIVPALMSIALFLAACDKKEDTAPTPAPTPAVTYYALSLSFTFTKGDLPYALNDYLQDGYFHYLQFDRVKFLISNIRLLDANDNVTKSFTDKVLLVDMANGAFTTHLLGDVPQGQLYKVAFDIGLDPVTNLMDPSQFSGPPLTDQTLYIDNMAGHRFYTLQGRVDADGNLIVGNNDQAINYQCYTDAMLRSDVVQTSTTVLGGPATVHLRIRMDNLLNGINAVTGSSAYGASAANAQLMSNLQSAIDIY